MQFFPNPAVLVQIGDFAIRWYAVLILIGAFSAYALSLREFKKMGYDAKTMDDLFFGVLIAGVLGTRLWYVAFSGDLSTYLANPLSILAMWEGGLAIQGGLLLAALYGYYWTKKRKINFMRIADGAVPTVMVAQAIGRWGNFANQEAFGRVVDPNFYQGWPTWFANHMFINGDFREPTFLYESVGNLVGFFIIIFIYKRFTSVKRGDMVYAYLMWYGVLRYFIEGFRSDSLMFMGLRSAQLVSIAFILIGIMGTLGVFRKLFPRKKPIILFDFDGTLMDTEPAVIASYEKLYQLYGKEAVLTPHLKQSLMGPPLKEVFLNHFEASKIEALIDEYRKINLELHESLVKPFEGVIDMLQALQTQGYRLGIVSSKHSDSIKFALDMFNMSDYFEVIVGVDQVLNHKPDNEPILKACQALGVGHDALIYVGDTAIDVQTATNIGAYSVAFISNEVRAEAVLAAKPNKVIRDWNEFASILKEEVEWTRTMM